MNNFVPSLNNFVPSLPKPLGIMENYGNCLRLTSDGGPTALMSILECQGG